MHPLIREVQKKQIKRIPEIKAGYTINVKQKIKEGEKTRIQSFEGLVIKVGHGEGLEKTITVRKVIGGIGVEKIFPLHSPNIDSIEVKKKAKVRRAKLYYMRNRFGKSARLQEKHVTAAERLEEEKRMDALIEEAVKADESKKAEEAKAESTSEEAKVENSETKEDNTSKEEKPADTSEEEKA